MPANKNKGVRFIQYWLPVIIYAILIFGLSSVPGGKIPQLFSFQDLFFHIIEYAIFAFLVSRALKAYKPGWTYIRRFFWVFLLSFLYAISDEFHQLFVPYRFSSVSDLVYDGAGIFMANIFYR